MNYIIKKIIVIFYPICMLLGCGNSNTSVSTISDNINSHTINELDEEEKANISEFLFESLSYNFGEVVQGEQLNYTFHFKNIGNSNLIISDIGASCGCTRPLPSKEPVAPGEKGEIAVSVNTKDKDGEMISYVIITANTYPTQTILTLCANVLSPCQ